MTPAEPTNPPRGMARLDLGSERWRRFLRERGIEPFDYPQGARMHWAKEMGLYAWGNGGFSPSAWSGRVPVEEPAMDGPAAT